MTELEAKTKWCPMMRSYHYAQENPEWPVSGYNAFQEEPRGHCIGSGCAMWRWRDSSDMPKAEHPMVPRQRLGFCGLAGSYFCKS